VCDRLADAFDGNKVGEGGELGIERKEGDVGKFE
jgi:hypothetical protein